MDSITKNKVSEWIPDFDINEAEEKKQYLRRLAESTVFNFIGRTMSTLRVDIDDSFDGKNNWEYKLNVRPNGQESASIFWHKFFVKLIKDNEVLVILRNDELLIADSFDKDTTSNIYKTVFQNVVINEYGFVNKNFKFDDVIYLKYSDIGVDDFSNQLFNDYGNLFDKAYSSALRNNQVRASLKIEQTGSYNTQKDAEGKTVNDRMQEYSQKLFKSFKNDSVAIVPLSKGMDYEEYTNKIGATNQSIYELNDVKKSLIDDLANAVGIPTALLYGEKSDLDSNTEAYRELCIKPLINKLQDELMLKVIPKEQYLNGTRLKVKNVLPQDPFKLATQIDKVISSGFYQPNEAREMFEIARSDDPAMDKHYITKNYESTEGGDSEDDGNGS